ncbi:hypothetical protein GCM10022209_21880 [Chitinophaga oryziterrae]
MLNRGIAVKVIIENAKIVRDNFHEIKNRLMLKDIFTNIEQLKKSNGVKANNKKLFSIDRGFTIDVFQKTAANPGIANIYDIAV